MYGMRRLRQRTMDVLNNLDDMAEQSARETFAATCLDANKGVRERFLAFLDTNERFQDKYGALIGKTDPDFDDDGSHWETHEFGGVFFNVCIDGVGFPVKSDDFCKQYSLQEIVRQPAKWEREIGRAALDRLRLREFQQMTRKTV